MVIMYTFSFGEYGISKFLFLLLAIATIAASHIFYRKEHKRRNRFWGRLMHDLIISVFTIHIILIITIISDTYYKTGGYSSLCFTVVFLVLFIELALSSLNFILNKLKFLKW